MASQNESVDPQATLPTATLWVLHTTRKGHPPICEWGKPGGTCRGPLVFATEAEAEGFKRGIGKRASHRRPKATTMEEIQAGARAKGQRFVWTVRRKPEGGLTFAGMGIGAVVGGVS